MTDTVRLRVSLSPMFSWGNPTQRPNGCGATHDQRAFVVSVVVNRFPLHARKEKTEVAPVRIGWLCQRGPQSFRHAVRSGLSLCPAHTGEIGWVFLPTLKRVPGEKRKRSYDYNSQGGSMTQDTLNQLVQDRYREAIKTHKAPNIQLIELRARLEVLERGETIEVEVSQ